MVRELHRLIGLDFADEAVAHEAGQHSHRGAAAQSPDRERSGELGGSRPAKGGPGARASQDESGAVQAKLPSLVAAEGGLCPGRARPRDQREAGESEDDP